MILIADSSALITLAVVDKLDILESLFGEVYVPRAVYNEVSQQTFCCVMTKKQRGLLRVLE